MYAYPDGISLYGTYTHVGGGIPAKVRMLHIPPFNVGNFRVQQTRADAAQQSEAAAVPRRAFFNEFRLNYFHTVRGGDDGAT